MIGAPLQVLRKEPNKSSTTTNIEAQLPALPSLVLSVKAIYLELTINDSSIKKLVETQSNQNK